MRRVERGKTVCELAKLSVQEGWRRGLAKSACWLGGLFLFMIGDLDESKAEAYDDDATTTSAASS